MRVLQITREVDRTELQEAIKKERRPKRRTWLEIVLFVLDGWQGKAVAAFLRVHPITVSRAVRRFNEEGLEGMRCRCQGRQSRLTQEAEAAIVDRVERALNADPQRQEVVRGSDLQQRLEND